MLETHALASIDKKVIGALLAHPRSRMSVLAATVGISAPTASRRIASLFERDLMRIVTVIDQQRTGRGFELFLRLRCVPGSSESVARAVAAWPESGYVSVVGGDLDCNAQIQVDSTFHLMELLTRRLKAIPGVTGSSTAKVIRRFSTPHGWTGGLMSAAELDALRKERLDHWDENSEHEQRVMDDLDRGLADVLSRNGRLPWKEMAAKLGVQAATARRRVEALMRAGILRQRTVIQPAVIGHPVVAALSLRVTPARLEAVGRTLATHPNVMNIAATTGLNNLSGEVAVADDNALYTFLTDDVGCLPGVGSVTLSDGLQVIKRASMVYDGPNQKHVVDEVR